MPNIIIEKKFDDESISLLMQYLKIKIENKKDNSIVNADELICKIYDIDEKL
jgi:hypothetical protein